MMKCIYISMSYTDGRESVFSSFIVDAKWTNKKAGKWVAKICSPTLATFRQTGRIDWHLVRQWERSEGQAAGLPALVDVFSMLCPDCSGCKCTKGGQSCN